MFLHLIHKKIKLLYFEYYRAFVEVSFSLFVVAYFDV